MMTVLKRGWIPLLVAVAVMLGTLGVTHFRALFGSDPVFTQPTGTEAIVSVNVKEVRYEVYGPPGTVGKVSYLDERSENRSDRFSTLPWTHTLSTTLPVVVAQIVAQGDSSALGCRITVNGVVKDDRSATGRSAQTSCLVKAA
ncbi:putative membrane protein, MmpS [Mycolicibacillus koreensis]|nr:putative membrane protein, MmpS [Mycolicibacillus koreensis]